MTDARNSDRITVFHVLPKHKQKRNGRVEVTNHYSELAVSGINCEDFQARISPASAGVIKRKAVIMGISRFRALPIACYVICFICGCDKGNSESEGRLTEVRARLSEVLREIDVLKAENKDLREKRESSDRKLAAANGGKGLNVEDQQRNLDERKVELEQRLSEIKERETQVAVSEKALQSKWEDFHARTNLTMEDIGQAKQVKADYENLRAERDKVQVAAEHWLKFFWAVAIAFVIVVIICCILLYRALAMYFSRKREAAQRAVMRDMMFATIAPLLPPGDSTNALRKLLDFERSTHVPQSGMNG